MKKILHFGFDRSTRAEECSEREMGVSVPDRQAEIVERPIVELVNGQGAGPLVVVCEHASTHIPPGLGNLGLSPGVGTSHVAWDPGAAEIALRLARRFDSPLVLGKVSRLVYDCNRPPEAPDAMPAVSEVYRIPGNEGLGETERAARIRTYYRPFEALLDETLAARPGAVLVTVHTFTPVFHGARRSVEIGIVHDADSRLADAILEVASGYDTRRNDPYGPAEGVTHTLKRHALPRGLLNVMIEVRNDLVATPAAAGAVADRIGGWLETALARLAAEAGA